MAPKWLSVDIVKALHSEVISRFGGSEGVRDAGLLESAIGRPQNLSAYGNDPSLPELAAAYCAGIVRNHPFVDGNKRTGLLMVRAFLFRNACAFEPNEAEEVAVMVALANGEIDESRLAGWIADNVTRSSGPAR